MNTTLTIKIEKKLRNDAKTTAKELGVPLTTVMNAMVRQFVRDRRLVLEAECPFPSHTPNAETRKAIREIQDYKAGKRVRMKSYASFEDFEKHVRSL